MEAAKKEIKAEIEEEEIQATTIEEFRDYIYQNYEIPFKMSSEEFWKRWKEGTIEDTFWTTRWAIELAGLRKMEEEAYRKRK